MPRQTFRQRRDAGISATISKINRDSIVTSDGHGELIVPRQPTAQEMFASALDILTPEEQEERYYAFPEDPVEFIQEVLGIYLWRKQREIVYSVFNNRYTSVASCHAAGKCLDPNQHVRMFDGSTKRAADVVVGDLLMGPDSTPRRVLSTTRGHDEMYRIVPNVGETWICNGPHMLSLRKGGDPEGPHRGSTPNGSVTDVSVYDYLRSDQEFKDRWNLFRVGVDYPSQDVPVDPYWIGVWLGEGSQHGPHITTADAEIVSVCVGIANQFGLTIRKTKKDGSKASTYHLASDKGWRTNGLMDALRSLNLYKNKHIPKCYAINDEDVRLALLAGLIDSDGSLDKKAYSITQKRESLARDIADLAQSLGFLATVKPRTSRIKSIGYECITWRVHISGDIQRIPVRIPKKREIQKGKKQKNPLNVGFSVEHIGVGPYAGFTLDGDHRFLLADYTVTHNTFSTAALILAFLNMKRNSIALSTAPTGRQVEHVLWRNIRRIYAEAKMPLLGNVPLTTRYDIAEQWYGIGFKPTDTETDPLQGFHADDILAVIDEAAGVVPVLIDGLQAAMTSEGAHMLQIGNPTSTAGPFFDSHHSQSDMWETFVIAAKDTPNFTGEPYPVPGKKWTGLITPEWVEEVIAKYGEGSAYVESRVHARFVSNEDVLIPLALIEAAEQPRLIQESGVHEAGVDVARAGKDKSVLTIRNGSTVKTQWELASGDSFKTADDVLSKIGTHGYPEAKYRIKVDETGIGAGVVDALKFRIRDNNLPHVVIPVNFGAKASDPEAFFNQRCEMFVSLAERFMKSNIYFPEPPKYQMKTELSDIRTSYDGKHTQPLIERKDDFRKRVGKSPDYADSLALAFYQPPRDIKKIGALSFGFAENRWGR